MNYQCDNCGGEFPLEKSDERTCPFCAAGRDFITNPGVTNLSDTEYFDLED